jgi:hypothetical protein
MSQPSTQWSESVSADEAQRHEEFAQALVQMQTRINAKRGPGRTFHRKPIAALVGTLVVPDSLPEHAAQGLFAQPGEHEVVIRMSNGAMVPQADPAPDIRGFALSVRGVAGPGALGGDTDRQDFLLINRPAFGYRDSRDFAELVPRAARGQRALLTHLVTKHGALRAPWEIARQGADLARPFSGFATSSFHSCAPVAWGPYAAHVHLAPVGARRSPLAMRDWGADVRSRIQRGPLAWDLQAQFYTDPEHTPIEDGRTPWRAPKTTVARLTATGLADAEAVEADRFDPWAALAAHRPLGEIMRARRAAYYPSYRNRA